MKYISVLFLLPPLGSYALVCSPSALGVWGQLILVVRAVVCSGGCWAAALTWLLRALWGMPCKPFQGVGHLIWQESSLRPALALYEVLTKSFTLAPLVSSLDLVSLTDSSTWSLPESGVLMLRLLSGEEEGKMSFQAQWVPASSCWVVLPSALRLSFYDE